MFSNKVKHWLNNGAYTIIIGTHIYLLIIGSLPKEQVIIHALLNIVAAAFLLFYR